MLAHQMMSPNTPLHGDLEIICVCEATLDRAASGYWKGGPLELPPSLEDGRITFNDFQDNLAIHIVHEMSHSQILVGLLLRTGMWLTTSYLRGFELIDYPRNCIEDVNYNGYPAYSWESMIGLAKDDPKSATFNASMCTFVF